MRDQTTAINDAQKHATELIDALQDGNAPRNVIDAAEALHTQVHDLDE